MSIEKIYKYFTDNQEVFISCLNIMDDYNDYLGDDRWSSMDCFDDAMHELFSPMELAVRIYWGKFNPYDVFWHFDSCGNIETCSNLDYSEYLNQHIIEDIINFFDKHPFELKENNFPEDFIALLEEK